MLLLCTSSLPFSRPFCLCLGLLVFVSGVFHTHLPVPQYELPENKVANVQPQLEKLVDKNYFLNKSAKDAYRGYLLAYASHSLKDIFDVYKLDLQVRCPRPVVCY